MENEKYSHNTLHWKFFHNVIAEIYADYDDIDLCIQPNDSDTIHTIPKISASEKCTYLGVTSSRDENQERQLKKLMNIA